MPRMYTVAEVADILGYSTNSIYAFLKAKRLKGVRLGKGRFRIPQSELDRLLVSSSKETPVIPSSPVPSFLSRHWSTVVHGDGVQDWPNTFDLFASASMAITGLALYLFNNIFDVLTLREWSWVLVGLRFGFIVCGFGLIGASLFAKRTFWKKLFRGILVATVTMFCILMAQSGVWDAVLFYGLIVAIVAINEFIHLGSAASFALYLTGVATGVPLIVLFDRNNRLVASALEYFQLSPLVGFMIIIVVSLFYIGVLCWGYFRQKSALWVAAWLGALVLFGLSFLYAKNLHWVRAFFTLTLGYSAVLFPTWGRIQMKPNHRYQSLAYAIFGFMIVTLLAGLLIVYTLQINIVDVKKNDIQNKISYGNTIVNSVVGSIQDTLVSAANNPEYIKAVSSGDAEALNKLNRLVFESNKNILRVVILDAIGDGVVLYPLGFFNQKNFAFRDYFQESKQTGLPFVTDVYIALVDEGQPRVVLISAPVLTQADEFVGVVGAYVNLDALAVKLQAVADARADEYFTLVDRKGRVIIDRNKEKLGSSVGADNPILLGLDGKDDVVMSSTLEDTQQAVIAYAPNTIGWALAITAPLSGMLGLSDAAVLTVFSVVMTAIALSSMLYVFVYQKMQRSVPADIPGKDSS